MLNADGYISESRAVWISSVMVRIADVLQSVLYLIVI
jgi:hypothetical protein